MPFFLLFFFFFLEQFFHTITGEKTDMTTNKLHSWHTEGTKYVTLHYAQYGFASSFVSSSQPFLHKHMGWCWKGETA